MSSFLSRVMSQQQVGYVPHTSVSGETWQLTFRGTTDGSTDSTSVIDSGVGGSNDDYNGRYWVKLTSGASKGEMKRVVDYDSGTGDFTVETTGFSATVASGVTYELWLSPEPVVVIDSSSGETNAVDAVRSEANNYWNGYYMVPITGTHRGKIAQITAFVSGTGTFTLAASFGSALAAGDVCLIRKFIETDTPGFSPEEPYLPRPQNRVNFSRGDGTVGARGGSVSFNTHIYASGTLAGAGSVANKSVLSGLFQGAGLVEAQDTSSTVAAGSNTTAIKINTGSWENHTIGSMVIWEGHARFVTNLTDGAGAADTVTVTPALPATPAASDVLYSTCMYRKTLDGDTYGVCIEWEADGYRTTMTGCKGSVSLTSGEPPTLAWNFSVDHYIEEVEAAPYNAVSAYTTEAAILEKDRSAWLSTTGTNIMGFNASPNTAVVAKNIQGSIGINGRAGYQVSDAGPAGASFTELVDASGSDLPSLTRWTARTSKDLIVTMGSFGSTCGVRLPAARLIERPTHTDSDGLVSTPNVVEAQDAGTQTDGGSTIRKVPDWALCLS